MSKQDVEQLIVHRGDDLTGALKQMDEGAEKILLVVDEEERLFGTISDGDIRRWILSRGELTGKVEEFCERDPLVMRKGFEPSEVETVMLEEKIEAIPVIDSDDRVVDIVFWEDVFGEQQEIDQDYETLEVPVVIMAGGKGTRLDPFTQVLPKPLVPVENESIIERIISRFRNYSIEKFYLTVNYMAETMRAYFKELDRDYEVEFVEEEKPLGTAGSLRKFLDNIDQDFFVSNCDILVDCDYAELYEYHRENDYDLTIVSAVRHFEIPYGICTISDGGELEEIREKPEYDFLVNSGFYVMSPEILELIPENQPYDITDLIEELQEQDRTIGVFPISEDSWRDVGEWDKYRETVTKLNE